jgi:two-component system chemotaxis response regulator CheB
MAINKIIVIGSSLGGVKGLKIILKSIPRDFPEPIVIVQHREGSNECGDDILINSLSKECALRVKEPLDKEIILKGCVYVAPKNYHLMLENNHFALSIEESLLHSIPSIDVLFESASDSFAEKVIGVILSGNNKDGANGLATIKNNGGFAIVQDPKSAEARIMPEAAIKACKVDKILPIGEIGEWIVRKTGGR